MCFVDRLTSLIAPVTNSNIFFCSLICIGCRVSLKHSHVVESVRRYLVHMYEYISRRNIHTPMRIMASTLRELFYIAPPNTAEDRCSIITPTANVVLIMLISYEAFPKLFSYCTRFVYAEYFTWINVKYAAFRFLNNSDSSFRFLLSIDLAVRRSTMEKYKTRFDK